MPIQTTITSNNLGTIIILGDVDIKYDSIYTFFSNSSERKILPTPDVALIEQTFENEDEEDGPGYV